MHYLFNQIKYGILFAVNTLNQPLVKDRVKSAVSPLSFVCGIFAAYDLMHIAAGRPICTEQPKRKKIQIH